jgi:hypothetical protein
MIVLGALLTIFAWRREWLGNWCSDEFSSTPPRSDIDNLDFGCGDAHSPQYGFTLQRAQHCGLLTRYAQDL